jgi:hypothetical protein
MGLIDHEISHLTMAIESRHPAILFGAGFIGVNTFFYTNALNVNVVGFCDNNVEKTSSKVCGLYVYSFEEAIKKFTNPVFIICSSHSYEAIKTQLVSHGITDVFSWLLPYYIYIIQKTKRPVNPDKFSQAIFCERESDSTMYFSSIAVRITEICNLNCKNCFAYVPYYKKPVHYDEIFLSSCISSLMASVDAVEMMGLTGGEPFLHPEIKEILSSIVQYSNIIQINITTNGTIVPKPDVLDYIAENGIIIQASNYDTLSANIAELECECAKHGILFLTSPLSLYWVNPHATERFNRSIDANRIIYSNCSVRKFCDGVIENGYFEQCPYIFRKSVLGMIPRDSSCHVSLTNENISVTERRSMMKAVQNKDVLSYCDYCDTYNVSVPAGEQATGKIIYKKYYER